VYSLDTSVFMDWQGRYYPLDVFVTLAGRVDELIVAGECAAVDVVKEEIDAIGTPDLKAWAKAHSGLFVALSTDIQREAAMIESAYPDLMDPKGVHESADAYVIALAKVRNGIVVSQETSVHEKHRPKADYYVPDVCRNLGIPCINLLGLMRREKWAM
jgi:hypothetical protein